LIKALRRQTLVIVVLAGPALSAGLLFYFIPKNSTQSSTQLIENADARAKQEQTNSGLPVRLKIPGINVDAPVQYVGLTPDGAMDVPKSPDEVAWYERGQRPGEKGSAVIAGHYGRWENGQGSVFDDLHTLRKGDKLSITDDKGVTTTFVVRESRRYDPAADASDVFGSSDGQAHLNLITCEGVWNETQKSYSDRLVLFTDKEME